MIFLSAARPRVGWLSALPLAAGLCACAPAESAGRHRALSQKLAASKRAASSTLSLGDVLERGELIRAILAQNPSVAAARHAWRSALAAEAQATALADPMLEYSFAPLSIGSESVDYGQVIGLSQTLPWPGKRDLRGQIALAGAEAAAADFRTVELALALRASLLFDGYFLAVRSLEKNAEHEVLLKTIRAAAIAAYSTGRGPQEDVLQAEVELSHIAHRALVFASQRDVAVAQLNGLLHRPPAAALPPPPPKLPADEELELPALEALIDRALRSRPELRVREAEREGGRAAVALANRETFPDVRVMASYNSMWGMVEHQLMVGVGINLPVWRGRRAAAVDEAGAELAATNSALSAAEDDIRVEIATARERLREAHHIVSLYRTELVPLARAQIKASQTAYETGRGSFLALIEAERNLRRVELDVEEARARLHMRRAELTAVLGELPGVGDTGVEP